MVLNSFCVIITNEKHEVLLWTRPTDLDSARALYNQKCKEYSGRVKDAFNLDTGEMYTGLIFDLKDMYTNKGIEDHIKMWGGDLTLTVPMVTGISYEFTNKDGLKIMLRHSTKT
jgi:hypothetical protein